MAEGSDRGTTQDNRLFLIIARGSLYETRHLLGRADKRNLLSSSQIESLLPLIREITPKLNAYIRKVGITVSEGANAKK
ncbi:MAG: four helix bundle protein [Blastocatellia bacterium]